MIPNALIPYTSEKVKAGANNLLVFCYYVLLSFKMPQ